MSEKQKEELVHQCLLENYKKYYKIAYSYTFQEQDACDIVQEAAYKAILKCGSLKQPKYADTWICRIVMNEAIHFLNKNRKNIVSIDAVLESGEKLPTEELQVEDMDLKCALDQLEEVEREIVILRYFQEEKFDTIGKILNLNTNTVKSKLYRGMEKLRKIYGDGGYQYERVEGNL